MVVHKLYLLLGTSNTAEFKTKYWTSFYLEPICCFTIKTSMRISRLLKKQFNRRSLLQMSIISFQCSTISKPKYDAELFVKIFICGCCYNQSVISSLLKWCKKKYKLKRSVNCSPSSVPVFAIMWLVVTWHLTASPWLLRDQKHIFVLIDSSPSSVEFFPH